MSFDVLIWGILAIASGVFLCVFGHMMFRFVLAVIGFMVAFSFVSSLTYGQPAFLHFMISLVAGAIGAAILYMLISFALYIAGAILGLVIAMLVLGLFGFGSDVAYWVVIIAGLGLGAFFGRRLGNLIIAIASAAAGAYFCVYGLALLFPSGFPGDVAADPSSALGSSFGLVLFLVVLAVSALCQYQMQMLQLRIRR